MTGMLQDLRYAVRQLRKSPGFTLVAVITLALGIGANTAIFSLINAIMLRTLPVKDPQSLVILTWSARKAPDVHSEWEQNGCPREMSLPGGCSFSYQTFQQIQKRQDVFSGMYALVPLGLTLNFNGHTNHVGGLFVSGDFFSVLGTHPVLGRLLGPADDSNAAVPAMVVSYRFWQTVLGADPEIVGKSILAGKTPVTVVGVAMPGFLDLDPGYPDDFWLPLSSQPVVAPYFPKRMARSLWLEIMGRLKPGLKATRAIAAMNAIFAADVASGPDAIFKQADLPRIELRTAARGFVTLRQRFADSLFSLLIAVGLVLTIACANIAGLTLARSAARRKEIALRAALGASRARLLRQFLTESVLLSAVGGGAGIILGYWGAKFLSANWQTPLRVGVRPDFHVLCFTFSVSVLVGLVFGLVPALSTGQVELVPVLKASDFGSARAPRGGVVTLGDTLVVVQMAIAMLILVGAGLLVRTFANLKAQNVGFDPKNLLVFSLDTTYSNRAGNNLELLNNDVKEQLAALPGVTSVSYSEVTFLTGGGITTDAFSSIQPNTPTVIDFLPIAPNFFGTMRIPLLAGRALNAQDSQYKRTNLGYRYVVVNEALALRFFGKGNPVGQHFRMGDPNAPESEIVGVVADGKYDSLRKAVQPTVYVPITGEGATFEVRTAMDPTALMPAVRATVTRFDSNLLITDMKSQMEQIDETIRQERLIANLSSLFALLALIVACVGIYGLLSYQVTRRTQEIGIRLALGAQRGDVLRLVIRQGAILAMSGGLIGIGAALGVTRYLQSFLFGVKPTDPLTIVAVAGLLIAVALLASYIPARRAMKTDPMVALRYE